MALNSTNGAALSKQSRKSESNPVDVYVGSRVAARRSKLGLSQSALAQKIGVSFQAVQKYEAGEVRISASRLYDLAKSLDAPPSFFFDGYPDGGTDANVTFGCEMTAEAIDADEIAAVISGYLSIPEPEMRVNVLQLIQKLGSRPQK